MHAPLVSSYSPTCIHEARYSTSPIRNLTLTQTHTTSDVIPAMLNVVPHLYGGIILLVFTCVPHSLTLYSFISLLVPDLPPLTTFIYRDNTDTKLLERPLRTRCAMTSTNNLQPLLWIGSLPFRRRSEASCLNNRLKAEIMTAVWAW